MSAVETLSQLVCAYIIVQYRSSWKELEISFIKQRQLVEYRSMSYATGFELKSPGYLSRRGPYTPAGLLGLLVRVDMSELSSNLRGATVPLLSCQHIGSMIHCC